MERGVVPEAGEEEEDNERLKEENALAL